MFNKRGAGTISEHMALWIPKFVYLAIVFVSVLFLLRMLIINNIDTSEAEARITINRIIYSPNVISYIEPDTKRSYPGIIDMDKYRVLQYTDVNTMDTNTITYGQENNVVAVKMSLKNIETGEESDVYYNKDKYLYWEPRILSTVTGGSGSVSHFFEQRYVQIMSGGRMQNGLLKLDVIERG